MNSRNGREGVCPVVLQVYRSAGGARGIHGRPNRLAAPLARGALDGRVVPESASNILVVVTRKVIFLRGDASPSPRSINLRVAPGSHPGQPEEMFEPCSIRGVPGLLKSLSGRRRFD